ncbi:hypothetical protein [Komagataeibacter diospyri]|uniref:hypothetical protein n=1 Tax=Komagataeibacter diospyri TaxID=1932662 RepID=UPI003756B52E
MGIFKSPKVVTPTPAPMAGQTVNNTVQGLQNSTTEAAKMAGGMGSTMLTGSSGLSQTATNAPKTLLGG